MKNPEIREIQQQSIVDKIQLMDLPKDQYVLAGSAAMVLHGLRLFDAFIDRGQRDNVIDIVVTPEYFGQLLADGRADKLDRLKIGCFGTRTVCPLNNQIFNAIDTSDAPTDSIGFATLSERATLVRGLPVMDLDSLRLWKQATGGRINRADVRLIDRYRAGQAITRLLHRSSGR